MAIGSLLKLLILTILVLLAVAFFTLYERKVLSYIQIRKGPNKLGFKGLLQPFSDAVKLFTKESNFMGVSHSALFVVGPILALTIALSLWMCFPSSLGVTEIQLGVIFILCCMSVGVYPTLVAGWTSNSKYPLLGGLRAAAQTISYEVSLALIILSICILYSSYYLSNLLLTPGPWTLFVAPPLAMVWFVTTLAETGRTPFDLAEGESELVSGFNTEYSASMFALFFLAEYGSILFMSGLFVVLFWGGSDLGPWIALKIALLAFMFIWVRGTLPRMRYDNLMTLAWKGFLPITLGIFTFHVGLKSMEMIM